MSREVIRTNFRYLLYNAIQIPLTSIPEKLPICTSLSWQLRLENESKSVDGDTNYGTYCTRYSEL